MPQPRRRAGVCFSSRQSTKRKLGQYGPEDAIPNAPTTGPLPLLRESADSDGAAALRSVPEPDSAALALALAAAANDTKAVDISVLDVAGVVTWTRYFVIATCFSRPQVDACISRMMTAAQAPPHVRELAHVPAVGSWVCMDYGDVMAHGASLLPFASRVVRRLTPLRARDQYSRPRTATSMTCPATTPRPRRCAAGPGGRLLRHRIADGFPLAQVELPFVSQKGA